MGTLRGQAEAEPEGHALEARGPATAPPGAGSAPGRRHDQLGSWSLAVPWCASLEPFSDLFVDCPGTPVVSAFLTPVRFRERAFPRAMPGNPPRSVLGLHTDSP